MMEYLQSLFKDPQAMVSIGAGFVAINIVLGSVSKILGVFKDKTATQVDNKVFEILGKASGILQKAIDWMQGNNKH